MSEKCKVTVWHGWHRHQCSRKAKKDGYCLQHHPDTVAAKKASREAQWAAESAARRDRTAREAAIRTFCEGFPTPALEGTSLREVVEVLRRARLGLKVLRLMLGAAGLKAGMERATEHVAEIEALLSRLEQPL